MYKMQEPEMQLPKRCTTDERSGEPDSAIGRCSGDRDKKILSEAAADMPIVIDTFSRMTGYPAGKPDGGTLLYLTYAEYALTALFFAGTCATMARSRSDRSTQLHGVLCLLIETFVLLCLPLRLYHRAEFRRMDPRARTVGIPDGFRRSIGYVTRYHATASTVFVAASALYAVAAESVRIGDPFTFPFLDVLPVATGDVTVYLCKYAVYALPVYIAHVEICFLNVTFMCSVGVVQQHSHLIMDHVGQALRDGDERKFKTAVVYHQDLLK